MRPRRTTSRWLLLLAAAALSGCGKETPAPASADATKTPRPSKVLASLAADASAEQVARASRGDVACPARSTLPPRAADAPVDDALGVRPGMTYDEAVAAVLCTHVLLVATPEESRHFQMKTYGQKIRQGFNARFAEPHVARSGQQIARDMQRDAMARSLNTQRDDMQPGTAKWYVATMGLPGRERVLSVGREERYLGEQSPTVEAVLGALRQKYGTPTHERRASATQLPTLRWAHDPAGRPVGEGAPLFSRCVSHPDPDVGINLVPECGIVVEALLVPQRTNAGLVDRLKLTIVDQGGGYRAIEATERTLAQADAERRAREVDRSAKAGKGPSL